MQCISNCMVFKKFTAYVHVLQFIRVVTKMNEEEERATLENFVDSSVLELLLNETNI